MKNAPMMNNETAGVAYGIAVGGVAFLLLLVLGGYGVFAAGFLAAIVVTFIAGGIYAIFCRPLPGPNETPPPAMRRSTKPGSTKPMAMTAQPAAAKKVAPAATPAPAPAAKAKPAEPKADAKTSGDGGQPQGLSAARAGGPDNLKELKGVGPKLENLLHDLGIFHFDQIAAWGPGEVAWMDDNLKGFKGRVSRDNWIEQAKTLAAGGETEFSKRVDEGDVY